MATGRTMDNGGTLRLHQESGAPWSALARLLEWKEGSHASDAAMTACTCLHGDES